MVTNFTQIRTMLHLFEERKDRITEHFNFINTKKYKKSTVFLYNIINNQKCCYIVTFWRDSVVLLQISAEKKETTY